MKVRGVGYGAAFAIIVLSLVIVMGSYYIMKTYNSADVALRNYANSLQKPQLELAGYTSTSNTITVHLVNKGPDAVIIKAVKLYKEDVYGTPTGTVDANITGTLYIPVGGSADIKFQVGDTTDYIFWNKPLRVMVISNKGIMTLAYPPMTGLIYVNIHLPTWTSEVPSFLNGLNVRITMNGHTTTPIPVSPNLVTKSCESVNPQVQTGFYGYDVCKNGKDVMIVIKSLAGASYKIQLYGNIKVPYIQYNKDLRNVDIRKEQPRFILEQKPIEYDSIASVPPGGSTEVSFTIPDVFYEYGPDMPHPQEQQSAWTIDFSWLYYYHGGSNRLAGLGNNESSVDYYRKVLTIAGRVVYAGLVTYSNPNGCSVFPVPTPPNHIHPPAPSAKKYAERAFQLTFNGHSMLTGIPIIVPDFPHSCNTTPAQGNPIITVKVKIPLRAGNYIIIPVISYDDDDDDNRLQVTLQATIRGPNGQKLAGAESLGMDRNLMDPLELE